VLAEQREFVFADTREDSGMDENSGLARTSPAAFAAGAAGGSRKEPSRAGPKEASSKCGASSEAARGKEEAIRSSAHIKIEEDAALETLLGHEVYVHGTGPARELRRDGVLRKVGENIRIESQGAVVTLNEFCKVAQNTLKRPREAIRLHKTGRSIKQTTDRILEHHGHDLSSSDDDGNQSRHASNPGSGGRGKEGKEGGEAEGEETEDRDEELVQCIEDYTPESEVDHAYNQPRVDLTLLLPAKRRTSVAAQKAEDERMQGALAACLDLLHELLSDEVCPPVIRAEESGGGRLEGIRTRLENKQYATHAAFASDVQAALERQRQVLASTGREAGKAGEGAAAEEAAGDGGATVAQQREEVDTFLFVFEKKYQAIADQTQREEEEMRRHTLPRPLNEMPQRHVEDWAILDEEGRYLAPWHATYGTLLASLAVPPRPPVGDEDEEEEERYRRLTPLRVRVSSPDEWHAQCMDLTGSALPRYWLRGAAAPSGADGPRGGTGKVWYLLGMPQARYARFLHTESSWLLGAYRIAAFLSFSPKSTFNEVVEVLAGRNFPQVALSSRREGDADAADDVPEKLEPIGLEHVLERAPRVLEEMSNLFPKLASHKFGISLMARHHKFVRRKARGLTGAQITSLRMMGGGGLANVRGEDGGDKREESACKVPKRSAWSQDKEKEEDKERAADGDAVPRSLLQLLSEAPDQHSPHDDDDDEEREPSGQHGQVELGRGSTAEEVGDTSD